MKAAPPTTDEDEGGNETGVGGRSRGGGHLELVARDQPEAGQGEGEHEDHADGEGEGEQVAEMSRGRAQTGRRGEQPDEESRDGWKQHEHCRAG